MSDTLLLNFKSEHLMLALCDHDDLTSLSDDLKSILLFKIASSLHTSLQIESKVYAGTSKNLTTFEKVEPKSFIRSDERCLPVIKFIEGITGKDFETIPIIPEFSNLKKLHVPESSKLRNCDLCGKIYESLLKLVNSACHPFHYPTRLTSDLK